MVGVRYKKIKKKKTTMVVVESVYIKQVMDVPIKIFYANHLIVQK